MARLRSCLTDLLRPSARLDRSASARRHERCGLSAMSRRRLRSHATRCGPDAAHRPIAAVGSLSARSTLKSSRAVAARDSRPEDADREVVGRHRERGAALLCGRAPYQRGRSWELSAYVHSGSDVCCSWLGRRRGGSHNPSATMSRWGPNLCNGHLYRPLICLVGAPTGHRILTQALSLDPPRGGRLSASSVRG
jgi:hypothetical protein